MPAEEELDYRRDQAALLGVLPTSETKEKCKRQNRSCSMLQDRIGGRPKRLQLLGQRADSSCIDRWMSVEIHQDGPDSKQDQQE